MALFLVPIILIILRVQYRYRVYNHYYSHINSGCLCIIYILVGSYYILSFRVVSVHFIFVSIIIFIITTQQFQVFVNVFFVFYIKSITVYNCSKGVSKCVSKFSSLSNISFILFKVVAKLIKKRTRRKKKHFLWCFCLTIKEQFVILFLFCFIDIFITFFGRYAYFIHDV